MKLLDNKYLQLSIVALLCLYLEYLCFGSILLSPNKEVFAFGGDALFLYFNTTYHACYGSGMMLESMNYPFGESIFMTDAQGALSILLSTLKSFGFDTCNYSIGIVNGTILYLLPLCAIFVHLILRRFKVNIFLSITLSVAIALMAPQTFRLGSHYGLSYPFYIPMCIYWVLRKFDLERWEWKDLLFILVTTFFYLNNPYVGFAGLLFIPIITITKALRSKVIKKFYLQYFGVTFSIILMGYAIIKLTDPFVNRIKEQNGFFVYNIDFFGLFNSPYGFTSKVLSRILTMPGSGIENTINYGIIPLSVLLFLPIIITITIYKKRSLNNFLPNKDFSYIVFGGILLSLVACNGILPQSVQDFVSANLRPLLLFKATGRFIWLSYFVITIWTAWWLSSLSQKIKSKYIKTIVLVLLSAIWIWESSSGLYKYAHKMSRSGNMFARSVKWKDYLKENKINPKEYQAILALPIMQGWSSKLSTPIPWRSQYESTTMSITTGLPLVDGMLSRMSLDHAMNIIQLVSNPLIKRDLITKMPDDRPILVMDMSESDPLPEHQDYILSRSQKLTTYKHFDLYKLELDSLQKTPSIDSVNQRYSNSDFGIAIHYNGFDNINTEDDFRFKKGVKTLKKGINKLLYSTELKPLKDSTELELSFWTLFTPLHEGTPKFNIQTFDIDGKQIENVYVDSRNSRDVKDNWVRVNAILKTSEKVKGIRVYSFSHKHEIVDDLLIRYLDEDVVIEGNGLNNYLWNNFIIERE